MKVIVTTCDGCWKAVENAREVRHLEGDYCSRCRAGAEVDLAGIAFRDWPAWLSKATVKRVLELRDRTEDALRAHLRDGERRTDELEKELGALRRRAAEGLREERLDVVLRDIASNGKRERETAT